MLVAHACLQEFLFIMELCQAVPRQQLIDDLPPAPTTTTLDADIAAQRSEGTLPVLVVLDDDPTGTQTCHGISVLMCWDHDTLVEELKSPTSGFFILTNSRAFPTDEARKLIREICSAVKTAAQEVGKDFELVLRGDSTLRGHFPDEPQVAEEVIGDGQACQWILAPFFRQGGRLTINDVHYVAEGDQLLPAAQTQFARDATFGYKNSNLRKYVAEKTSGDISEEDVASISLVDIRRGGAAAVARSLMDIPSNSKVIVLNAVVDEDMEIAVQGILQARKQGRRYIYRTGAAFVSTRLGIRQIPPLTPSDLSMAKSPSAAGGLTLAGSYVPKTTAQLKSLIVGRGEMLKVILVEVEDLLQSPQKTQRTILAAADEAGLHIVRGQDVLLMTSRKLITAEQGSKMSNLEIGGIVAQSLVDFLRLVNPRPRYVIAKVRTKLPEPIA